MTDAMKRGTIGGAALAGALLLSACGDVPAAEYATNVFEAARSYGDAPAPEPTREQLYAANVAVIALRRTGAGRSAYLGAQTAIDDAVTYVSLNGPSATLRGGAIVAHRGVGFDLMSLVSSDDDPLITETPLDQWPESVVRAYQMRGGDGRIHTRSVVCTPIRGVAQQVDIKGITFDLVEVEDRCRSGDLAFTNRYWVAPETGFVWKSVQWTGPDMISLTLEVIRPYASPS